MPTLFNAFKEPFYRPVRLIVVVRVSIKILVRSANGIMNGTSYMPARLGNMLAVA